MVISKYYIFTYVVFTEEILFTIEIAYIMNGTWLDKTYQIYQVLK